MVIIVEKYKKIFIDTSGNLALFPIDARKDLDNTSYYNYVKNKKAGGYNQFLLTSDIMINIATDFLSIGNNNVSNISLYDNDDIETKQEILSYFNQYSSQELSAEKLKSNLDYLYNVNSIDIVAITIKNDNFGTIQIRNNGIISYKNEDMKNTFMNIVNKIWEMD